MKNILQSFTPRQSHVQTMSASDTEAYLSADAAQTPRRMPDWYNDSPAPMTTSQTPQDRNQAGFFERFWTVSGSNDFGNDEDKENYCSRKVSKATTSTSQTSSRNLTPYVPRHAAADFSRINIHSGPGRRAVSKHRRPAAWQDDEKSIGSSTCFSTGSVPIGGGFIVHEDLQQPSQGAPTSRETEHAVAASNDYERFLAQAEVAQHFFFLHKDMPRTSGEQTLCDSEYEQAQPEQDLRIKTHNRVAKKIADYIKPPRNA